MNRTRPHEIDTRAQRILQYKLPDNVVIRMQFSDDYGIDAEIENFENQKSTGTIFKIQLKGQDKPTYTNAGKFISFSFPVRKATYLIEEITIPTIFILVDVLAEKVYWSDIHGNQFLIGAYEEAKRLGNENFTIHFDINHTLSDTLPQLLKTIDKSADFISLRRVARIHTPVYSSFVSELGDIENELRHLGQKYEIANAEKLRRWIEDGEYDKAEELIAQILESTERSPQAKFDSLFQSETIFNQKYAGNEGVISKIDFDLAWSDDLTNFAQQTNDDRLLLLAKVYKVASELLYLANHDMQLFLNWKLHSNSSSDDQATSNPFWLSSLKVERSKVTNMVLDKYEVFSKLIPDLIDSDWLFVPDVVTRMIFSLNIFHLRLKEEKLDTQAANVEKWINGLIEFVMPLAEKMPKAHQRDAIFDRCSIAFEMQITITTNDENTKLKKLELAAESILRIQDPNLKKIAQDRLDALRDRSLSSPREEDVDWKSLEEFYKHQAKAFGIELSLAKTKIYDVNHPSYWDAQLAWIIDLGIRDLNPTRVLKNCEHLLYRYYGGIGEIALAMKLDSARMKLMGCVKHLEHGARGGYSLDELYDNFYKEFCSKCPHHQPHGEDWKYTTQWHIQRIKDWEDEQGKYKSNKSK